MVKKRSDGIKPFTKIPDEARRTSWLPRVRVAQAERAAIETYAHQCCMHIGDYMRTRSLRRPTPSQDNANLLNELRLIGNTLKELHRAGNTGNSQQLSTAMAELVQAMKRVGQGRGGE